MTKDNAVERQGPRETEARRSALRAAGQQPRGLARAIRTLEEDGSREAFQIVLQELQQALGPEGKDR